MRPYHVVVAAVLALAACGERAPETIHDRFPALGTLIDVTVRDAPADILPPTLRTVRTSFDRAGVEWAGWGDGALARYNDGTLPADAALQALLDDAMELSRLSGGLFDPRIGALTELWGFHVGERPPGPPPPYVRIQAWLDGRLPARVDLGAYAKGVALAKAVATLHEAGIRHALVNAGGDVAVLGDAGGRAWRIGIRDPRGPGVLAGVELADGESIFTSGDYERAFEWEGTRYHHILDPRTGRPARGTASVTVIDTDPARADAASTALFVAGDAWAEVAAAMGVRSVMRVTDDGRIEMSPAMAERITLERTTMTTRTMDVADPAG